MNPRSAFLVLLSISFLIVVPNMLHPAASISSGPRVRTYDVSSRVSRSWAMAMDGPIIYLAGDSVMLSIIDTRLLDSEGLGAITQVQAFPDSGCGNFVSAEGGLIVKNGIAWISGNYNVGYALSRIALNNLTRQTYMQCDTNSPILGGLASDSDNNIYGGFESAGKGVARFNDTTHTWITIAGTLGSSRLLIDEDTVWFTVWPRGLGRVNTNGTGQIVFNTGFTTFTRDLARDDQGRIWFTGDHIIGVFNPTTQEVREFPYGTGDGPIGLAFDANKKLWVTGFWNKNIREFDPSTLSWNTDVETSFPTGLPDSITPGGGAMWGTILDPMLLFEVNLGPIATFTYSPSPPLVGHLAKFNGSGSSSLYGPIANYRWDFGDGVTSFGAIASHAFASTGTYDVNLTVTDLSGRSDSVQELLYVSVHIYAPAVTSGTSASYGLTLVSPNGTSVSVDLQATVISVSGSNVTYQANISRDGATVSYSTSTIDVAREGRPDLVPPFFVAAAGLNAGEPLYPAGILTAFQFSTSNSTRLSSVLRTVNILDFEADNLTFRGIWDRATGILGIINVGLPNGSTVIYKLQSTNAWSVLSSSFMTATHDLLGISFHPKTTGGQAPYNYYWNFGDGRSSADAEPTHTFQAPGTYDVVLTVVDSAGNTKVIRQEVTVTLTKPPFASSANGSLSLFLGGFNLFEILAQIIVGAVAVLVVLFQERARGRKYARSMR